MRVLLQRLEHREKIACSDKVDHIVIERQGLPRMIISEQTGKLFIYQGDKVIYSEGEEPEKVTRETIPVVGERL